MIDQATAKTLQSHGFIVDQEIKPIITLTIPFPPTPYSSVVTDL